MNLFAEVKKTLRSKYLFDAIAIIISRQFVFAYYVIQNKMICWIYSNIVTSDGV